MENCTVTLQRGGDVISEASRISVDPSAYVRVMFLAGKSSSFISKTWTPTETWPLVRSMQAVWGYSRVWVHRHCSVKITQLGTIPFKQ